ncbi:methyl-CpG-binding domain protein 6-like isoform X2 [Grus americana]|uniref:methyl-CpG-binding domain protein 6-like isoform X2 n=1 Tax=Grus americana TaxID=9117 RepID=UPI002407A90D|nr:methyl-CpG-binding domain protein 6-like isoform X2 [Grus americana]
MQRGGTMSSSDDSTGTEQPMCPSAGPVPVGWELKVEEGSMCYISPSGTTLTSLEQTCAYLLADGACKCGLECPLNTHKVFNFDPGAMVAGRGAPGAQGQQDMTKLCNHRRKAVAMATLYHSMEGTLGPCHPGTGPSLSLLFSAKGHLATAPSTGVPLPSTVGNFPRVPLGVKTLEATSAPAGTFLQPHDIVPGANGSPTSHPPATPCFGLRLPLPDVAAVPLRSLVVPLAKRTQSQHPTGRTSDWAAPSQGGTGESPELGGLGPCLPATTGAPQAGKVDSSVSNALTSQSSNNLPVPLDAVPKGRGFLGLAPLSTPFPTSSLLSLAAKTQLGSPDLVPTPSTLPPCLLLPSMLRSLVGEQVLGREAQWPQCLDLQDPAAHRVPSEPKGMHPPVTGQPLAALLNLLGIQSCLGGGGPGEPTLPLGPLPVTNGLPCPGIGLLPTGRDCSGQLLGLFGQLAASSEPTSGTSPQSKASGRNHSPRNLLALSPLLQNRPLLPSTLPPLGLSLGPGQGPPPQGTTSPLAGLLQSLQGSSLHLRPSCRGWRKAASTPQPSACLETLQQRGLSASPGASPTADLSAARGPWPGRPVKNCRRKLLT